MEREFKGRNILVTGGTGSIGSEVVRQLLKYKPNQLRIFSRDENKQSELIEELERPSNVRLLIGDIRDRERLLFAFKNIDIVFHAAAMKHVDIGEYNPFEVVKTNIIGSQNVISAAIEERVKKVIGVSTDKAVNPAGVLGISKLMMEKLFLNANYYTKRSVTRFCCVRFGNVTWSRGSVLPLWREQAKRHHSLSVTDADMSRFFMSKEEAARLIIKAAVLTQGGEIFTRKMHSIRLKDLTSIFVQKYFPESAIKVRLVGPRDGEKKDEFIFDPATPYRHIFTDGEFTIFIPLIQIDKAAAMQLQKMRYRGFREIKKPDYYSSAQCINADEIGKII